MQCRETHKQQRALQETLCQQPPHLCHMCGSRVAQANADVGLLPCSPVGFNKQRHKHTEKVIGTDTIMGGQVRNRQFSPSEMGIGKKTAKAGKRKRAQCRT